MTVGYITLQQISVSATMNTATREGHRIAKQNIWKHYVLQALVSSPVFRVRVSQEDFSSHKIFRRK
jgi:hypothetical protein